MIVETPSSRRRWAALAFAGLAVLALGVACEMPSPTEVEAPPAPAAEAVAELPQDVIVLVDGTERPRSALDHIPPERIERVEVVKGDAARRLYGERGAAGVVAVFTRPPTDEEIREAPAFTPFTVAPDITNRSEIIAAMAAEYPPLLREAGVEGSARVHFLIDRDGQVLRTVLDQASGHEALDQAAMRVASVYRFSPALNRDEPVPVWISLPISFRRDRPR